jgi:hypothetical protein
MEAVASHPNDRHVWPAHWQTDPSSPNQSVVPLVQW